MNLELLRESKDILAIILFGSTARKDEDIYSDKDVFILCNDLTLDELLRLKINHILPRIDKAMSICCYRYKDAVLMAKQGSLFMLHLKLQGKIIFSKDSIIEKILDRLKPYENYEKDLKYYAELLSDVKESFSRRKKLSEFDLSLLFTIARNTCILLCYRCGTPKFGRSNAYLTARKHLGKNFPMPNWMYPKLSSWKLWYERGVKPHRNLSEDMKEISVIYHIDKLIKFAWDECI